MEAPPGEFQDEILLRHESDVYFSECELLGLLKEYVRNLLENTDTTTSAANLESKLAKHLSDWQLMSSKGKQGLDAGTTGETLSHLVGVGFLEDFPEMRKFDPARDVVGTRLIRQPLIKKDKARFLMGVAFSGPNESEQVYFGQFNFSTSFLDIRKREGIVKSKLLDVNKRIEELVLK